MWLYVSDSLDSGRPQRTWTRVCKGPNEQTAGPIENLQILDSGRSQRTWTRASKGPNEQTAGPIENLANPGFWEASEDLDQDA